MARFSEWSDELEQALAEPFPKALHTNKGKKGTFVSIHHYVARLNDLVGVNGWAMETPQSFHAGNKLGLGVGITVLGVTKWNVGDEMEDHGEPDEDNVVRDYGSSSTNSFAQAFKRCCAYGFGLGLYLYDKDFTKRYLAAPERRGPVEAMAQQAKDAKPMTESQDTRIKALMGARELTAKQFAGMQEKVNAGLTHAQAEGYIAWLETLPQMTGATA